jgi:hypothetical protein
MFSDRPEHLLVAEAGTDPRSRFAVLAGVRVDDPAVAARQLAQADDERILEVMPLTVHVRGTLEMDLTSRQYGAFRVRTRSVDAGESYLQLPDLVARLFHEAAEDDVDRPSVARARYDRVVPRLRVVEDLGHNLTYGEGAAFSDALVRTSFRVPT